MLRGVPLAALLLVGFAADARVAQILLAGNMTSNNRRHQGVVTVSLNTV